MMSARKYLTNRVQEALKCWLSKGEWKVEVFANPGDIKLITPPGLDFNIVKLVSILK